MKPQFLLTILVFSTFSLFAQTADYKTYDENVNWLANLLSQCVEQYYSASYDVRKGTSANGANKDESTPGLVWVQFNDVDMRRPMDHGVDAIANLDIGASANEFTRVWFGYLTLPHTGKIHFFAEADDGLELRIDNQLIIDGWCKPATRSGTVAGVAGQRVLIDLRFWQIGGTAHLRFYWSWDGQERTLVPASAFSHTREQLAAAMDWNMGKIGPYSRRRDCSYIYEPGKTERPSVPIRLGKGPHLFIDDYLIETTENVTRCVVQPVRSLDDPIVSGTSGPGDNCFQPFFEVIRDTHTRRFRIWYDVPVSMSQSHFAYMESEDGVHWIRPHRVLGDPSPIQFGVSVIDDGPSYPDAARRFKIGYYGLGAKGLRIAASPDGLKWTPLADRTFVPHWHDINNIYRDPIRDQYMAIVNTYIEGPRWSGHRRVTMQTTSDDLRNWEQPWIILTPDDSIEDGETQFYAMCGFIARGDLLIGMVKVLHDDYAADPGGEQAGVGWTSLAWTRDGEHWVRDREVFFDRHPKSGQWDHAMAWIDCQLPVDEEVFIYYAGYARGHKINRLEERQIGVVKMKRDRYVARKAGAHAGLLITTPVVLSGDQLFLNVEAKDGEVLVRLVGEDGQPIDGFGFDDCRPIRVDGLDVPVSWRGSLAEIGGKTIRIEFRMRRASLFGFGIKTLNLHLIEQNQANHY